MFDDVERLRDNAALAKLLAHYADLGKDQREIWQDRVMQVEGVDARELSRLHGELIAFDWIEQNTGAAALRDDGVVAACYRITLNGMRDSCQIRGVPVAVAPADRKPLRAARTKKLSYPSTETAMPVETDLRLVTEEMTA